MKISVIGSGYVGLVAGACFANMGMTVCCIDKDAGKIALLNQGKIHIHEPGLEEMVGNLVASKHLSFSSDINKFDESNIIFLAVGTPSSNDGSADTSGIMEAVKEIAKMSTSDKIVIIKSTVPVGTAKVVKDLFSKLRSDIEFSVVSNPEFLREGSAVQDFVDPDRIVIGCDSINARNVLDAVYKPITSRDIPILFTDNQTAELIKYAANSYLAMRIAYINEIADLCERIGADIEEVATGIGYDKRIGRHYLHPGPGYGGSCFPKDTLAISYFANQINSPLEIINRVIKSNDERKDRMADKIINALSGVSSKQVCILGLTFKADTDDMRESASLTIIPKLLEAGFKVKAYDPSHPTEARKALPEAVELCDNLNDALNGAVAAVILTEWSEFRLLMPEDFKSRLKGNIVIDLRNLYSPLKMKEGGIRYLSLGRAEV